MEKIFVEKEVKRQTEIRIILQERVNRSEKRIKIKLIAMCVNRNLGTF